MTKNENIQANKNRIIPVIRQLFDSDMVTQLHFNIKAFESYKNYKNYLFN